MKYLRSVIGKIARLLIQASSLTDISTAQRKLAFDDSQKFIYDNSSLATSAFNGPNAVRELHTYCIENVNKDGEIFEFGVFKATTFNFFAKSLQNLGDDRVIVGFDSWKGFSEEWSGVNDRFKVDTFNQNSKFTQGRTKYSSG